MHHRARQARLQYEVTVGGQLDFPCGSEGVDGADPPSEFRRAEGGLRSATGTRGQQCAGDGILAFGRGNQREHAVACGHDDVVALPHAQQEGIDIGGHDGEAVGVGDRHAVPGQCDPEGGIGGGVDDADSDALSRLGGERRRRGGDSAVDEVVRVADVAAVSPEQITGAGTADARHSHSRRHSTLCTWWHRGCLPGGDDVVDPQDHVGHFCGRLDCLGLDAERLDDVELQHVVGLAGVQVDAHVLAVLLLVRALQLDDHIDGVQSAVLGEGPRDYVHGVGECLDGQLLPSSDGGGVGCEP